MTFLPVQVPDPLFGAFCALGSAITWAVISLLVRTVSPPLSSVAVSILRSLTGGALLLACSGLALIVFARPAGGPRHGRTGFGLGAATTASVAWAVSLLLLKPAMGSLDAVTAQAVRLPLAGLVLLATPWGWGGRPRWAARGAACSRGWRSSALSRRAARCSSSRG